MGATGQVGLKEKHPSKLHGLKCADTRHKENLRGVVLVNVRCIHFCEQDTDPSQLIFQLLYVVPFCCRFKKKITEA